MSFTWKPSLKNVVDIVMARNGTSIFLTIATTARMESYKTPLMFGHFMESIPHLVLWCLFINLHKIFIPLLDKLSFLSLILISPDLDISYSVLSCYELIFTIFPSICDDEQTQNELKLSLLCSLMCCAIVSSRKVGVVQSIPIVILHLEIISLHKVSSLMGVPAISSISLALFWAIADLKVSGYELSLVFFAMHYSLTDFLNTLPSPSITRPLPILHLVLIISALGLICTIFIGNL
jgi:hypothetical protein